MQTTNTSIDLHIYGCSQTRSELRSDKSAKNLISCMRTQYFATGGREHSPSHAIPPLQNFFLTLNFLLPQFFSISFKQPIQFLPRSALPPLNHTSTVIRFTNTVSQTQLHSFNVCYLYPFTQSGNNRVAKALAMLTDQRGVAAKHPFVTGICYKWF